MADNPFDQFDGAVAPDTPTQKATAPDATAAQPTSSTALAQPAANPFDQFDGHSPTSQPATAVPPAKTIAAGYTTQGGFDDELPAHAHEMPPEIQKQIVNILSTHPVETAASDARQFAASKGYNPAPAQNSKYADSFDEVAAYRKTHGVVSDSVINKLPDPTQSGQPQGAGPAFVRGLLPTNTADAALHTAKDVLTGDTHGSAVDDFRRWEDTNYGILQADEAQHPIARLTGQLIGGLAIPSGAEGEALIAGKSVLRAGGTMREARAAAAAAAAKRIGKEGVAVGSGYGFDASAPGQGAVGAAEGAAVGGAGGYTLAKAAPYVASVASKIGDLVGSGSAPDYVQLARDLKIRRTPATNSGTGVSTVIQSGLAALPGGAPIAAAASRETGDLSAAAKGVAEDLGQVSDRQGAGEAIAQGAQSYKASSRLTANDMYGQRDALIGGPEAPVPTDNAKAALDNIAARFPTSPAIAQLREHPAIRAIGGALPGEPTVENVPTGLLDANGQPMTRAVTSGGQPLALGEVTEALSHVRGVVRNLESQTANGKATAPVLARAKQVEQGLEDDVMAAAQKADIAAGRTPGAEGSAVRAQRDADAFYADRASALNGSLKKALKSAADDTQMSGEAVYNQVANDMDAKAGNLARLRDTWFRLPPAAKSTFAATRIDDLGRAMPGQQNDAGSAWSFNTFLTNLNKMSPQARNIVFGTKADADLQKIAAYADRLKQLDRARNFSNTAQKYFAGAFMAAVGGAVLHGDIGGAAEAAMAIPVTWGGAKLLLATPAMRDWTAQAMRALTTNNGTAMKVLTRQLGTIASTHPAIANQVSGLQKAITNAANDNLHSLAASGSQQNPDGEPKKANGTR